MTARIIDGKALAAEVRNALVPRIERLNAAGHRPGLAVILVGDDPASAVYVRNKGIACEQIGIRSTIDRLPADTTEIALLARIGQLNADPEVHGILVQTPLPKHLDSAKIVESIAFEKDVDGLHATNAGLTLMGTPYFRSCTPYGVMKMLQSINATDRRPSRSRARTLEHGRQADGDAAAGGQCNRHDRAQQDARSRFAYAHGRHPGRRGGQTQSGDRGDGEARRGGDRRRHQPHAGRQARRRRRFRQRQAGCRLDFAGARRRRTDDDRDAFD